jgi:FKBP-type peptidyl-prolyl cis-trans isomerase
VSVLWCSSPSSRSPVSCASHVRFVFRPLTGDRATVHSIARLENGTVFADTHGDWGVQVFKLGNANDVVIGVSEGMRGMCVGETRSLTVGSRCSSALLLLSSPFPDSCHCPFSGHHFSGACRLLFVCCLRGCAYLSLVCVSLPPYLNARLFVAFLLRTLLQWCLVTVLDPP